MTPILFAHTQADIEKERDRSEIKQEDRQLYPFYQEKTMERRNLIRFY